jgi:hypothetical protein
LQNSNSNNVNPSSSSSSCTLSHSILDPNPSLIDDDGNLINDISKAADITTYRNGTIADGVSKLILVVDSNNELQFSINGTKPDDLTNGTLSCLNQSNVDKLRSTAKVNPKDIGNVRSVVAAIYTPPDSFNQDIGRNRNIDINVSDPNSPNDRTLYELPIKLYRPPVILVHGLWMNSDNTWAATDSNKTPFTKRLDDNGFTYTFADYEKSCFSII